jgi:hypothetical protein
MSKDKIDCRAVFTVKLSIINYRENMEDTVQEKLYWDGGESHADIGWCAGTHIASAIKRLFPGTEAAAERQNCFKSIIDTFDADTAGGDYEKEE